MKHEELSTYGVDIEAADYHSTIISSLPLHLSNFMSNLLVNARLYASSKTVGPDELIALISEELEQNVAHCSCWGGKSSKGDDKDEAMAASGGKSEKKRTCWNCGKEGHFKQQCKKPPKDSEKKEVNNKKTNWKKKKGRSVNTAAESGSESDEAFAIFKVEDSDSGDESDWFLAVRATL